mmetsp:Transcript_30573/g.63076  ORF Transcript_30573/g.63076 Transcript_30573/m.63076 type:complete len:214 (-) Transcript_30573:122-763(-)
MQHLKACPWDKNTPWRPATLQLGITTSEQREDMAMAKNTFRYGETAKKVAQPCGQEETFRMAARSRGAEAFPSRDALRSASYLPGGWEDYQRLNKPDFTKSFSYIRNGCSLTGRGGIFEASLQRRPQTSESVALEEPLVPPAHSESLEKLSTRTWTQITRPHTSTGSMRMSASMPFIEAKEAKTALHAASSRTSYPLIRGLTREKALNASLRL